MRYDDNELELEAVDVLGGTDGDDLFDEDLDVAGLSADDGLDADDDRAQGLAAVSPPRAPERKPVRRRRGVAMPLLFTVLTTGFVAIAVFAALAGSWVFVAVGAALAAWMGSFALQAARPRRG